MIAMIRIRFWCCDSPEKGSVRLARPPVLGYLA
jgi:hypothetical protein